MLEPRQDPGAPVAEIAMFMFANYVLVKRIIRASGVLRGLTSCRYSWPMVGGTLQSVTSHESVLLVDAALL